jgi:hypothetical protein
MFIFILLSQISMPALGWLRKVDPQCCIIRAPHALPCLSISLSNAFFPFCLEVCADGSHSQFLPSFSLSLLVCFFICLSCLGVSNEPQHSSKPFLQFARPLVHLFINGAAEEVLRLRLNTPFLLYAFSTCVSSACRSRPSFASFPGLSSLLAYHVARANAQLSAFVHTTHRSGFLAAPFPIVLADSSISWTHVPR